LSILTLAAVVGVLFAAGTFLILRRSPIKLILGLGLLSHGVNLLLFGTGGLQRGMPPIIADKDEFKGVIDGFVDPLPQALILTAIVISFAVTAFTVVLVSRRNMLVDSMESEQPGLPSRKATDPFLHDEMQAWKGLDGDSNDSDDYEWLEYSLRNDERWRRAQEKLEKERTENIVEESDSEISDSEISDSEISDSEISDSAPFKSTMPNAAIDTSTYEEDTNEEEDRS